MKTLPLGAILLLNFVAVCLQAQDCRTERVDWPGGSISCDTGNYQLVFSDEFNENRLDTNKWYTYYPYGPQKSDQCQVCRTHGDGERQVYLKENLIFTDSTLQLTAFRKDTIWMGAPKPFTSGMIHSKQHFQYGRFEIRCKIPKGRGLWPAFWVWGKDEIDFFEFCGHQPNQLKSNLHFNCEGRHYTDSERHKGPNYASSFQIVSVEWEPEHVIWRVNGEKIREVFALSTADGKALNCGTEVPPGELIKNNMISAQWMQVIANLAICDKGGYCKRKGVHKRTPFPAVFEIDYIRVYQKKKRIKLLP